MKKKTRDAYTELLNSITITTGIQYTQLRALLTKQLDTYGHYKLKNITNDSQCRLINHRQCALPVTDIIGRSHYLLRVIVDRLLVHYLWQISFPNIITIGNVTNIFCQFRVTCYRKQHIIIQGKEFYISYRDE